MALNKTKKIVSVKSNSTPSSMSKRVSADKAFWLKSDHGKIVAVCHSIKELADTVDKSPDSVFRFHTRGGNDFSKWISGVFNDKALAQKVSKAKTKKQFVFLLRG